MGYFEHSTKRVNKYYHRYDNLWKIIGAIFFCLCTNSFLFSQNILYYCEKPQILNGTFQVYKKNLDSGSIEIITNDPGFNYWWVELSPNNDQLVMLRSPVGEGIDDIFDYEYCQMILSNEDGTNSQIIIENNQFDWNAFGNPHWHPSGDRILMIAQPNDSFFIYTIDADGSNPTQITDEFTLDPNWSSDGDKIVYIGLNQNAPFPQSVDDFEVFTANYDYESNSLSNINQLTDDNLRDHDPCFSLDDNYIAFSSGNSDLTVANIVSINTDGTNRIDIVNDGNTNGGPINWGSDGKIYYHNIEFFVTPFTVKSVELSTNPFTIGVNNDLFPSIDFGYISPYFVDLDYTSISEISISSSFFIIKNPININEDLEIAITGSFNSIPYSIGNLKGEKITGGNIFPGQKTIPLNVTKPGYYILTMDIEGQAIAKQFVIQ